MDEFLQNRVDKQVRKALLSSVRSDSPEVEKILSLNEREFSFIVDQVYALQSKAVTIAFREKESLILPAFGHFKFRPAAEKVFEYIHTTLKQYGYNKMSEIKDPLIRATISKALEPTIKQIYFDNITHQRKIEVYGKNF